MWSSLLGGNKKKGANETAKAAASLALRAAAKPDVSAPPIHPDEMKGSLSDTERRLNQQMKCPAGKNQVFIRSLVTAQGTTKPRIALKCHLRKDVGLGPEVFYEHIRDTCCSNPDGCPAYAKFKDRFVPT